MDAIWTYVNQWRIKKDKKADSFMKALYSRRIGDKIIQID